MRTFTATAVFAFVLYLLFTMGSGDIGFAIGFWSFEELMIGVIVAMITGLAARKLFCASGNMRMANPGRWGLFIAYFFGPFIFAMAKANLDVAYRVITGRIRPGIVRIETGLKNDLEVLMLANSITLTPGTLTVDVDEETNDLFIHWINVEKGQEKKAKVEAAKVCGSFPKWARRISR